MIVVSWPNPRGPAPSARSAHAAAPEVLKASQCVTANVGSPARVRDADTSVSPAHIWRYSAAAVRYLVLTSILIACPGPTPSYREGGGGSGATGAGQNVGAGGSAGAGAGGHATGGLAGTGGLGPTCIDAVANGEETDVDCGGPDCGACPEGDACTDATDCTTDLCEFGTCAVPCIPSQEPLGSLVAWWHLDDTLSLQWFGGPTDGEHIYPDSLFARHAHLSGSVTTTAMGFTAGAASLTGGFLEVPDAPELNVTQGITVDAFVRTAIGGVVLSKFDDITGAGYSLVVTSTRELRWRVADIDLTCALVPENVFTHVAATYDPLSGVARVFVDGDVVCKAEGVGMGLANTAGPLRLGADASGTETFVGELDEVRLFGRALLPYRVKSLASDGYCSPIAPLRWIGPEACPWLTEEPFYHQATGYQATMVHYKVNCDIPVIFSSDFIDHVPTNERMPHFRLTVPGAVRLSRVGFAAGSNSAAPAQWNYELSAPNAPSHMGTEFTLLGQENHGPINAADFWGPRNVSIETTAGASFHLRFRPTAAPNPVTTQWWIPYLDAVGTNLSP